MQETSLRRTLERADQQVVTAHATPPSTAVEGTITFAKQDLFNQTFLYGFDLQYSTGADALHQPMTQAEALGLYPAFFRRVGDDLQLIEDLRRLFESDINHPEQLLVTYHILQESAETLTVTLAAGSQAVNDAFNGKPVATGAVRGSADAPKKAWVRSVQYIPEGQLLLQETGLMLPNGIVQTFMESIFPRSQLVPEGYHGLENEPRFEPLASRYRFMDIEPIYTDHRAEGGLMTRQKTKFAPRFDLERTPLLDWYVTANAPDAYLPLLKSGVEGWNRYFRPQLGRDVLRFKGRLPAGIRLGDPRYNVINLDVNTQGGAAYGSLAADPYTGIKSHGMVYMPSLWTAYDLDEAPIKKFSPQAFMAILFHEIGHNLGLAHNYKGSLAFDASKARGPSNPTTWSIMDYNYTQNEADAFAEAGGADGPIYEYDRQMISQLYHSGLDVKATDPVLPTCDDHDADRTEGGVDPLCVRFDAENDPSLTIVHAWNNIASAGQVMGSESKTLTQRLRAASVPAHADIIGDLIGYYLSAGSGSLESSLTSNEKALRMWQPGVPVDEAAFRGRYLLGLQQAMTLQALPDNPKAALADLTATIAPENRPIFAAAVQKKIDQALANLRSRIYPTLKYDAKNPIALELSPDGVPSQFEELGQDYLSKGCLRGLSPWSAASVPLQTERKAAVAALSTYCPVSAVCDEVRIQFRKAEAEAKQAHQTVAVQSIRELLADLARFTPQP